MSFRIFLFFGVSIVLFRFKIVLYFCRSVLYLLRLDLLDLLFWFLLDTSRL